MNYVLIFDKNKKYIFIKKTKIMPVINEQLLFDHGAVSARFVPDEIIFAENTLCNHYYQLREGTVKLNHFAENGKEFIHGFPFAGHCLGESYLFTDKKYAFNAIAISHGELIKIPKDSFLSLLESDPQLSLRISRYTAERLHFRCVISSLMVVSCPIERLVRVLDHLKEYFGVEDRFSFQVPYTRGQLCALVGLRIETVIRSLKKMQKMNIVKIEKTKIYY